MKYAITIVVAIFMVVLSFFVGRTYEKKYGLNSHFLELYREAGLSDERIIELVKKVSEWKGEMFHEDFKGSVVALGIYQKLDQSVSEETREFTAIFATEFYRHYAEKAEKDPSELFTKYLVKVELLGETDPLIKKHMKSNQTVEPTR